MPLPPNRAFVVQLTDAECRADDMMGRIEHIASGRHAHFKLTGELVAFITGILADLSQQPDGRDA